MAHLEHCPTCLRREHVDGEVRTVEQPGGARSPAEHPTLAAWRILLRSRAGELGPVVGACAACGMPRIADADLPAAPWTLDTPEGPVIIGESPVDEAALTKTLEVAYAEPIDWGAGALSSVASLSVLIPILLWILAVIVVSGIFFEAFKVNFLGVPASPFE